MSTARTWLTLPDPFSSMTDTSEVITGHISGRSADITKIITGSQSAILLAGAPHIGKSALIRYLQRPVGAEWSWRDELPELREEWHLDHTHFVLVDLTPRHSIESVDQLLKFFIKQCSSALQPFLSEGAGEASDDIKDLYHLLRVLYNRQEDARYFLMFDSVERLERSGTRLLELSSAPSRAQTAQERSIALLDRCGALHSLVDLMDDFSNFGVIFALESLPRASMSDQFRQVSADLARFTSMTLQTFTWNDTVRLLQQPPEHFGSRWASQFYALGGTDIFSEAEQAWICRYAGTHPYLLQQVCFHLFRFKQEYAQLHNAWSELLPGGEKLPVESISEPVSPFLSSLWKRLQDALKESQPETEARFREFIRSLGSKSADETIDDSTWANLGGELRYILQNEGLVRVDLFQPVHYPGRLICQYLLQKRQESATAPQQGFWLTINRPGSQKLQVSLSEREYGLLKTLLQHPIRCPEEQLMKGAWGKPIDKSAFTQRMHQLRKKLRLQSGEVEIIENHYGGFYSLNHPEWFYPE